MQSPKQIILEQFNDKHNKWLKEFNDFENESDIFINEVKIFEDSINNFLNAYYTKISLLKKNTTELETFNNFKKSYSDKTKQFFENISEYNTKITDMKTLINEYSETIKSLSNNFDRTDEPHLIVNISMLEDTYEPDIETVKTNLIIDLNKLIEFFAELKKSFNISDLDLTSKLYH
jgi:hypothetical protein